MTKKKALITGITGQDGHYLQLLLLSKGYEVHGIHRWNRSTYDGASPLSKENTSDSQISLHYSDLSDSASLCRILEKIGPSEVYNLAAQSNVKASFEMPEQTGEITGLGCTRLLDAIYHVNPKIRFFQASSSEIFGKAKETPQTELSHFHPRSPYGVSKLYAHWMTINYRESYGLHASSGILYNHESPRRGEAFVTRKITRALARIVAGKQQELVLGNLEARRDWGHAKDYVQAMWLMLQQQNPDDYVIATGKTHSIRDFLAEAFGLLDLDWQKYVKTSDNYLRPAEVDSLVGNATKAQKNLGWKPMYDFRALVQEMVTHDLQLEGIDFNEAAGTKKRAA